MRIVEEKYDLPPSEVRRTGRAVRRVYWIEHEQKRIGPYSRRGEAVAIFKRAMRLIDGEMAT